MNTVETLIAESPSSLTHVGNGLEDTVNTASTPSLRDSVDLAVNNYFQHLEGQDVTDVYEMVLSEVETPLLEVVKPKPPRFWA